MIKTEEERYFGKTYDEMLDSSIRELSKGMEDHEFHHFNDALGMMIYSKEHYIVEMKKKRMLPYDACHELADNWDKQNAHKPMQRLSEKANSIIESLKCTADKKGNIKLGDRAINALIEIGAITRTRDVSDFNIQGGFS